ncbi:DUF2339 domain-containing protein [Yoonia sp. I 8.24]|uniref:DUF2339 domain-containing protein n=1 Tax=Yoonia sp. I 8.24 TaxID=1537229 RepID=UPI001EDEC474|nr:DUF2339 domain-containing protein [Yoonia sp. I 8.24]MCG3268814.1 DUF2339 domain-containing protein [Yoonia sp. I 8.24]
MEALLLLAVVVTLAIPLTIIYLLVSNVSLRERVAALEEAYLRQAREAPVAVPPKAQALPAKPSPAAKAAIVKQAPIPIPAAEPTAESAAPIEEPPKSVVVNSTNFAALISWLMQNWFYAVSAVSLALAGIFLVLYGIEQGLLPPLVRVMVAFAFGAVLIGAGEYIRRRYGDEEGRSTAYLPSTFSGAGIVTLFAAVLAARLLYGFIGPELALVGMAFVGTVALVLGWFYGPLLAAVGIIGAMGAPFIIDGSSDNPSWLLGYFAIVTILGLAIDAFRRWAWVSVISLTLGFATGFFLMFSAGFMAQAPFVIYCAILAAAGIAIPLRKLVPDHQGTLLSLTMFAHSEQDRWPEFPTRLAGGAVAAASGLIALTTFDASHTDLFWVGIVALSGMVLALLVWARDATALADLAALPATAFAVVAASGVRIWNEQAILAREAEADLPMSATILIAISLVLSILAAWRSLRGGQAQLFMAMGAATFAPIVAIALDVYWQPVGVIGTYIWALHAMAIAGVMVAIAERFARVDGPQDRQRTSFAALSALACIAFGIVILFSSAALTTALAVTVVTAAWLDRQFNLPLMGLYILAGIVTIGYRLVIDPGLLWATDAPFWEMLLSYGGAVAAFAVSWYFVKTAKRPRSEVLLESAVFSATAILVSLLLFRAILEWGGVGASDSHWAIGLIATVWFALGMAQLRRLEIGGALALLRKIQSGLFLLIGLLQLIIIVLPLNPVFGMIPDPILGPNIFNTLIPAYLLPALLLILGAKWLHNIPTALKRCFIATAVVLLSLWLGLAIRHFWRGPNGMSLPEMGQPELYTYTVALLVVGAALFYQSLASSRAVLRKAGLAVIGLAVAKVFMVDISGLGGLIRVFSLLFLGLSLAGLAWLNRWAIDQKGRT